VVAGSVGELGVDVNDVAVAGYEGGPERPADQQMVEVDFIVEVAN
jgi:hypothetical protein